jgi:hypothetical protein
VQTNPPPNAISLLQPSSGSPAGVATIEAEREPVETSTPEPLPQEHLSSLSPTPHHSPPRGTADLDLVGALHQALTANHGATLDAQVYHMAPVKDQLDHLQWTLPGSQTLTTQALEVTNTYIDQSQFRDGISPLTKIYPQHTPNPINLFN